jgi:periplasmic copper chaperone A
MFVNRLIGIAACALFAPALLAQTTVKDPWVRSTVAQQKASAAFMQISSASGGKLVSAASPVAGVVEIHEMAMEGTTMKMRAVAGLELPAGKPVALTPGGYHVMLMDLKSALKAGDTVDLTLVVEGKDGKRESIAVKAPVRAMGVEGEHKH